MSPSIFALFVLIPALFASGTRIVTVFMVSCVFGATAAIEVTALGGAPITPAVFCLPFLVWRALKANGWAGLLAPVRYPLAGSWLFFLAIWGVTSAFILPRYFAGDTYVFTTSRTSGSLGVALVLLAPGSTNITQSCYLLGSLAAFVAIQSLLMHDDGLRAFRDAVIAATAVDLLAGLLGLIEAYTGLPFGLAWIRNANYGTFTEVVEVAGLVRIQGTFPEASAFAGFTAPLMVCMAVLWRYGQRPRITGPLALVGFSMLALSTSSSAYGTMLIYGSIISVLGAWRYLTRNGQTTLGWGAALIWLILFAVCLTVLLNPQLFSRIRDFFEVTLWTKLESTSGIERSSWNERGWRNFVDTYGIGVGLGSSRASSFPVVLLSNLGIIGVVLFGAFILQTLRVPSIGPAVKNSPIALAAGHAVVVSLITASVSGTVFDLGIAFYAYAAAASVGTCSMSSRHVDRRKPSSEQNVVTRKNFDGACQVPPTALPQSNIRH